MRFSPATTPRVAYWPARKLKGPPGSTERMKRSSAMVRRSVTRAVKNLSGLTSGVSGIGREEESTGYEAAGKEKRDCLDGPVVVAAPLRVSPRLRALQLLCGEALLPFSSFGRAFASFAVGRLADQ